MNKQKKKPEQLKLKHTKGEKKKQTLKLLEDTMQEEREFFPQNPEREITRQMSFLFLYLSKKLNNSNNKTTNQHSENRILKQQLDRSPFKGKTRILIKATRSNYKNLHSL